MEIQTKQKTNNYLSKDAIWCKAVMEELAGGWYILKLGYVIFVCGKWQVANMHRAMVKKCCLFYE